MHICNIHILIPTPWTSPNAEAAKVYLASSLWIEIPYTSGSFDGNNGQDGSLEPQKAVLCSPPVKFLAGGEHSWFVSAWYADNCILCVFLTCRKNSSWRTYGEYFCSFLFATESVKNVWWNSWVNYASLRAHSTVIRITEYLLQWCGLRALYEVYWTTVKVFT